MNMNGSTDLLTIQQNITTYIQKNAKDKIDALRWESLGDGKHRLLLYKGGDQSGLMFTTSELQSYILKGWEQRFQEKLRSVVDDGQ